MNKYKVTITRQYTQSYEIYAHDDMEALEKADEKFSDIELKGEDLEYIGEDKAELLEEGEQEDPNAYDEDLELSKFLHGGEE